MRFLHGNVISIHSSKCCTIVNIIFKKAEILNQKVVTGAQWLSGRVLDSRPKGRGFKPHRRHCVVSLSKNINPSLVLVQPRKTCPFITERLLMGRKESNKTNKQTKGCKLIASFCTAPSAVTGGGDNNDLLVLIVDLRGYVVIKCN